MKFRSLVLFLAAPLLLAMGDPATETEHVVESGETLSQIAERAGVSLSIIAAANGLAEPYSVRVGQKLVIPRQRTHTVRSGETGLGIANRYGVAWSAIRTANNIGQNGAIRVGQRLIIPAVFTPRTPARSAAAPSRPHFRRPHDGELLLGWRRRADGGGHEGWDFAVREGDMIRAAASGTVIYAGREPRRFGNMVVIEHPGGYHTIYGHLGSVTVKQGELIRAGERLGLGGQSGAAERPELHFEIRRNRRPVDPARFLDSAD